MADRAAPVLGGGPGAPYLCALGCSGPGWRRGRGERRRVRERRGAGRAPGEAAAGVGGYAGKDRGSRDSGAGSEAVAGEAAERRAFKGALTFLGILLANGRRPGRGRGGQSGFLSPPPAAWRIAFQLESGGLGGRRGSGRRAVESL